MNKVRLNIGYTSLVLGSADAMKLFSLLNKDTLYVHDTRYVKDDEGKSQAIELIKPFNERITMTGVDRKDYALWKLAGEQA